MERSLDVRLYVVNSDQSLLATSQHSTMSGPTSLAEFCIFHRSIRQNGRMSSRTRVLCRSAVILFASNRGACCELRQVTNAQSNFRCCFQSWKYILPSSVLYDIGTNFTVQSILLSVYVASTYVETRKIVKIDRIYHERFIFKTKLRFTSFALKYILETWLCRWNMAPFERRITQIAK